jgi:signal transduction histidine kinase
MRLTRHTIIAAVSIAVCSIISIDILLGNFIGLSSIMTGWASMTLITAALFIILFSTVLFTSNTHKKGLFILLAFLSVINFVLALIFDDRSLLSSLATSALFFVLSLHGLLFVQKKLVGVRFTTELLVYVISNISLIFYFLDPNQLYQLPGFESVSWNTAIGFLLYSSTLLSSYYNDLLPHQNFPKRVPFLNQRFVDLFFTSSFFFPVFIILSISVLHFLGLVSTAVGMALGLFFVCIIPLPLTYTIFSRAAEWSLSIYKKNRQILERDQDIKYHNQLLQEFAQITSHNLRGPIVGINNLVHMIKTDEFESEEEKIQSLNIMFDSIGNLTNSVDNLAEFYNMIRLGEVQYEKCDIKDVFENVIKGCADTYKISRQQISVEYQLEVAIVEYPKVYIENIAYNLVSNSFKYRNKNRDLVINISTKNNANESTDLIFSDNGLGMDLKYFKNKIFKFGTSYHNLDVSNGIGLFIVYSQLARLGDSIDVESEEGSFTRFTLKLNQDGKKNLGYS